MVPSSKVAARLMRRPANDPSFRPREILAGLSPSLIIELARLAGRSLEQVTISLQTIPFGDRAVMAAYGLVVLGSDAVPGPRPLRVTSLCLEVIAEAAEFVAESADPFVLARQLRLLADRVPAGDEYVPLVAPDTSVPETGDAVGDYSLEGVVTATESCGAGRVRVWIGFPSVGPLRGDRGAPLVVVTDASTALYAEATVSVAFVHDAAGRRAAVGVVTEEAGGASC